MNKKKYTDSELKKLYESSGCNEQELQRYIMCACFNCGRKLMTSDISDWVIEDSGRKSAICPYCDSDTIIPDDGRGDLSKEKLMALKKYYEEWVVASRIHI